MGDPREAFLGRDNPYGEDMVVNIVLYATKRRLIEDKEVYHRIKGMFSAFDNRLGYLISLVDFVERFGASEHRSCSGILPDHFLNTFLKSPGVV